MNTVDPKILKAAQQWLSDAYDENTRNEVKKLIETNPTELTEAFYKNLEFGTGGLRGIMGVGTNRMNKYTVGMATQGLANYLIKMFPNDKEIKVAIAFDSRNNSAYFAQITAEVLSANNFKVLLFDRLRPTPELSFAIRYHKCNSGIVITASHNPKEYNGYKVYWNDGAQLINPHDENVIKEVEKIKDVSEVKFKAIPNNIQIIGKETDEAYLQTLQSLSMAKNLSKQALSQKIVYTPLHGTGVELVPACLQRFGFTQIELVNEQCVSDGNFPTVKSPNPEESAALSMAIEKAIKVNADLVMATDPDADRVGIAIRDKNGKFILLNGNQTAAILTHYLLLQWKNQQRLKGNEFVVKTIVTSELIKVIAEKFKVECYDVLTGFKYIADVIRTNEGKKKFIGGGEESYGYLVGDYVRDKDAVIACAMIAEVAAWAFDQGKTLYDVLLDIYKEYGLYKEGLLSITKKGIEGSEAIKAMMEQYRKNPPVEINGSKVVEVKDYLLRIAKNIKSNKTSDINLPKSDVLQFLLEDETLITVRPSGTEPKIKFYFGVKGNLAHYNNLEEAMNALDAKIQAIIKAMQLQ